LITGLPVSMFTPKAKSYRPWNKTYEKRRKGR
jgi:hypothetical protein